MTANEFGVEGHFVIVRRRNLRNPRQQWHSQWRSNYRTIAWSEKYSSRENALAGIRTLPGGAAWLESKTPLEVDLRAGKRPAPPRRDDDPGYDEYDGNPE